jgi:hypothetical protein
MAEPEISNWPNMRKFLNFPYTTLLIIELLTVLYYNLLISNIIIEVIFMETINKAWVEIEINKGTNEICSYRGKILIAELEGWIAGTLTKPVVKLEKTYWVTKNYNATVEQYEYTYNVLGEEEGEFTNFSGDLYIRADKILMIYILRNGMEREAYDL